MNLIDYLWLTIATLIILWTATLLVLVWSYSRCRQYESQAKVIRGELLRRLVPTRNPLDGE
jgi:hypothetical protein